MLFSLFAASSIVVLSVSLTPADLPLASWLEFAMALFLGGCVFCPLGFALGFWTTEKSSLPIGNLIYLPLTFAGGLWKPPHILPTSIQEISKYLPTRHYGEILWSVVKQEPLAPKNVWSLAAFAVLFSIIAFFGYIKNKEKRNA
jgi:ABC-2 type transport system permease protein